MNRSRYIISILCVLLMSLGIQAQTAKAYKSAEWGNPISPCIFCADPTAIEHGGRLYVYGTNDQQEFDENGGKGENTYGKIRTLVVFSTADMVNWTFHGTIDAGTVGASWCWASWAPSIVAREKADGGKQFYLYFSNGSTVGVLTATSPLGPWQSPLSHNLIDYDTAGVGECAWVFDPGVVIDDYGTGWLAFGGGDANSKGTNLMPGNARIAKLKDDMISIDQIVDLPAPYHFEANELNMMNGKWVLTYCSSWTERSDWSQYSSSHDAPSACSMCYMVSDNPLDPSSWEYRGEYVPNEGNFDLGWGNNHTHLHKFKDGYYLFYQSTLLELSMNTGASGFRSICVNKATVNEQNQQLDKLTLDKTGVAAICTLNPYELQQAETMSTAGGIAYSDFKSIEKVDFNSYDNDASTNLQVSMKSGSWTMLRNVDFGSKGASSLIIRAKGNGKLEVRLDEFDSAPVAELAFSSEDFADHVTNTNHAQLNGVHDVYLVFAEASNVQFDAWQFTESKKAPGEFETASEAVKNMKVGWNLVNTLDSYVQPEEAWFDITSCEAWETAWGNPVTKPELLKMIRKAGFNTMRIPVTWFVHADSQGNIDAKWMKRVHEVVDYVIDQGMYCILNTHHDTGFGYDEEAGVITHPAKLIADADNYRENKEWFENVWRQIANEFKDYDQHLLFEGYNEMTDNTNSFSFPSDQFDETHVQEAYQAINDYAQSFVNAVRSTGGNNLERNLVVNTYSACVGPVEEDWCRRPYMEMKIPNDVTENHIIFGIHCYWMGNEDDARGIINNVNKCFTSRGVPTIISEYGIGMDNLDIALTKQASENGIAPIIWNHDFCDGIVRLLPAFDDTDKVKAALKAFYGDWYEPTLLATADYDDKIKVTFKEYEAELGLFDGNNSPYSLDECIGFRVVLKDTPEPGKLQINAWGENGLQTLDIQSKSATIIFDKSQIGERLPFVTLQSKYSDSHVVEIDSTMAILTKEPYTERTLGWNNHDCDVIFFRKQFVHTVAYDYLWAELNLFYDDIPLKLKNYKGIRLELAEEPKDVHIKVYGDGEQKEDYIGIEAASSTILFNTDFFSNEINRVTLQFNKEGQGEVKVISAWLIRQDGTEEYSDLTPFHGCEIKSKTAYVTAIEPVIEMSQSGLTPSCHQGIFNLNGQRLSQPQKGINVINGKKIVIK